MQCLLETVPYVMNTLTIQMRDFAKTVGKDSTGVIVVAGIIQNINVITAMLKWSKS